MLLFLTCHRKVFNNENRNNIAILKFYCLTLALQSPELYSISCCVNECECVNIKDENSRNFCVNIFPLWKIIYKLRKADFWSSFEVLPRNWFLFRYSQRYKNTMIDIWRCIFKKNNMAVCKIHQSMDLE